MSSYIKSPPFCIRTSSLLCSYISPDIVLCTESQNFRVIFALYEYAYYTPSFACQSFIFCLMIQHKQWEANDDNKDKDRPNYICTQIQSPLRNETHFYLIQIYKLSININNYSYIDFILRVSCKREVICFVRIKGHTRVPYTLVFFLTISFAYFINVIFP